MLYGWKKNSFKICGIPVLKAKFKKGKTNIYLCGILICSKRTDLAEIIEKVQNNKSFDTHSLDKEISLLAPQLEYKRKKTNSQRVAFIATELYNMGGHTKCLRDFQKAVSESFEECLFLVNLSASWKNAFQEMQHIKKYSKIDGIEQNYLLFNKSITTLFDKIIQFNPKALIVFIHPDDILGTAVLYLIKKYTDIRILYCPHASHFPNLGISFADLVLEALPVSAYITQKFRKINKTLISRSLISKSIEENPSFTKEQIAAKRKELGIKDGYKCTMSGASSYKFFEQNTSEYFETIKTLLERNPKLQHIVISHFKNEETAVINEIFKKSETRNRLLIVPFSNEYELMFASSDVFIDSFPIGSALTQIDLMRLKVPSVVKINTENALWSFHEYMPQDYMYMFENAKDLILGVEKLLSDKEECKRISEANYKHYLKYFEGNAVKRNACEMLKNIDCPEQFYCKLDPSVSYKFKDKME